MLAGSLHHGSIVRPPERPPADDEMPSMEVLNSLHADALRGARSHLRLASSMLVPLVAVALIVGNVPITFPLWLPAIAVAGYFGDAVFEWWIIRRQDPIERWRAEREQAADELSGAREHATRVAGALPKTSYGLAVAICAVTIVQFLGPGVRDSIALAALVKPAVFAGEWWRLFSVAFLHGHVGHLLSNIGALVVLGPMIEIYDRPIRVPLVFLVGVASGAVASTMFSSASSVGASGGILALAGYVLAADVRLSRAPEWMRRQVTHGLAMTALIGMMGFFFIDNAAHVGGFVGGMVVGRIARSAKRHPNGTLFRRLDAAGWIAAFALIVTAILTTGRLLQAW